MHELSLCRALLAQLEPLARRHGAQVTRVVLRIGPLSGADPDLLRHAFPQAASGTCADGADLVLQPDPIRVHCPDCGEESAVPINDLACPRCGNARTRLLSGNALDLLRVELEPTEAKDAPCVTHADVPPVAPR